MFYKHIICIQIERLLENKNGYLLLDGKYGR